MNCTWVESTMDSSVAEYFGIAVDSLPTKEVTAAVLSSFLYNGDCYVVVGTDGGLMVPAAAVQFDG